MTQAKRQYLMACIVGLVFFCLQVSDICNYYLAPILDSPNYPQKSLSWSSIALTHPAKVATILWYILLLASLQMVLPVVGTCIYRAATQKWPGIQGKSYVFVGFLISILTAATLWNSALFPYSIVFANADLMLVQAGGREFLWVLTAVIVATTILAAANLARLHPGRTAAAIACIGGLLFIDRLPAPSLAANAQIRESAKPNIIILGVDSFRYDFLARNDPAKKGLMPTMDGLISSMALVQDALTPVARTFVSYMSIFSGQYPIRNGARFNLQPRVSFSRNGLLPNRLRADGYSTFYATDESRFANIDESFGFDSIELPPEGILDFLIGSLFDSVATNLLALTPVDRWLFRQTYANRAANRIYRPDQFSDRLRRLVARMPTDKPVFFVTHFCLAHWPYDRGNAYEEESDEASVESAADPNVFLPQYKRALRKVDLQVSEALKELKARGFIDNAIIIVLSDHGEGLGLDKEDILQSRSHDVGLLDKVSRGHGNHALADTQQRVVLAFQRYEQGSPVWPARDIKGPADLIDLTPTILDAVGISFAPTEFDGISLLPQLEHRMETVPERIRFVESELRSPSVDTNKIDERAVAAEFASIYVPTQEFRFEINPNYLPKYLSTKQRGAYSKQYGLIAEPQPLDAQPDTCPWQLADFTERTIRCLTSPNETAEASLLAKAICDEFRSDIDFHQRWCVNSGVLANQGRSEFPTTGIN